jgi:hypothetical protein
MSCVLVCGCVVSICHWVGHLIRVEWIVSWVDRMRARAPAHRVCTHVSTVGEREEGG